MSTLRPRPGAPDRGQEGSDQLQFPLATLSLVYSTNVFKSRCLFFRRFMLMRTGNKTLSRRFTDTLLVILSAPERPQ